MLHTPVRARRRADLRLSVTFGTLPAQRAYHWHEISPGHYLVEVREGITYGALARAYTAGLPPWARWRLYTILGVVDHARHPVLYDRTRWWDEEWPVCAEVVHALEHAGAEGGLVSPWPHAWLLEQPA